MVLAKVYFLLWGRRHLHCHISLSTHPGSNVLARTDLADISWHRAPVKAALEILADGLFRMKHMYNSKLKSAATVLQNE